MAILNREVRAIQNPALGSVLIWRAASSYQKSTFLQATSCHLPLALFWFYRSSITKRQPRSLVFYDVRAASGLRKLD